MGRRAWAAVILVSATLLFGGCGNHDGGLRVSSTAFADGGRIPERYSCLGLDVSPPLRWSNVPMATRELVLVVTDPDAPSGTFYHWVLYAIPAGRRTLAEHEVPAGAHQGTASSEAVGYVGMCPPTGQRHTYHFTVSALDRPTGLTDGARPAEVEAAMQGHVLARGELTGTFGQ